MKVTAVGANPIRIIRVTTPTRPDSATAPSSILLQRGEQASLVAGDQLQLVCEETVESIARRDATAASTENLCVYVAEIATVPVSHLRGDPAQRDALGVGSPAKVSRTAPPRPWGDAADFSAASHFAAGSGADGMGPPGMPPPRPPTLEPAMRADPSNCDGTACSPSKLLPRSNGHVISHEEAHHVSPSENQPPELNGGHDFDAEGQSQACPIELD